MLASSEARVTLPDGVALHARPAAIFVRTAMKYKARISVVVNDREADAKSILSVLALGARAGTTLRLVAEGEDARDAVDALTSSVTSLTE
ncbi:MAG TPA: HPr family phosphocarrier protein [Candidatus Acidoferrales bacterium]|jgi:phosphocarrier protein HPr|nr:HPr family phosphocarrier protein [Candidatus Acidoferrales bacterium]